MKSNKPQKYKEIYPKELFEIITHYAKRYSEISGQPFLQVLREQTPVYFFIGNYNWDVDLNSKYSLEFESRVLNGDEIADVIYEMQNKYYKRLSKEEDWFGCFKYKYAVDKKSGDKIIKIHFRNFDQTGLGPLAKENTTLRLNELTRMFSNIRQHHPKAAYVQGGSWLYNYESYCRLFPRGFTEGMSSRPSQTHYMIIWGQFINSEKVLIEKMKGEFLDNIANANSIEELQISFRYPEMVPKAKIGLFFDFYCVLR